MENDKKLNIKRDIRKIGKGLFLLALALDFLFVFLLAVFPEIEVGAVFLCVLTLVGFFVWKGEFKNVSNIDTSSMSILDPRNPAGPNYIYRN